MFFLDIEMPELNGFQVLEQFEEINFKIIITTAYDQYAIKALKYNAMDYLLKPIDIEELEHAIDEYHKNELQNSKEQIV